MNQFSCVTILPLRRGPHVLEMSGMIGIRSIVSCVVVEFSYSAL